MVQILLLAKVTFKVTPNPWTYSSFLNAGANLNYIAKFQKISTYLSVVFPKLQVPCTPTHPHGSAPVCRYSIWCTMYNYNMRLALIIFALEIGRGYVWSLWLELLLF